jgi:hypothetical protein
MHLQSLCGLLNVPPLLHMKRKFCGGGHRWLHSFILALHRSLHMYSQGAAKHWAMSAGMWTIPSSRQQCCW